jgi:NAD(P)-dependent dehydrogenase (short-subunit alcohol dehydrogenase family)
VANLVESTMQRWGRIDVLIANAGILRDKSFSKMELNDFSAVVDVHLMGAVKPLKALWEIFKAQNYGRVVVTTSSTGLYGNFGQANYGAAKLSLVGLMNTMKLEGAKNDIRFNAISPVAATRMTESLMPPEMLAKLGPEEVTPGVVFLASKDAPNGAILTAGAGVFALAQIVETEGAFLGAGASAENVRDHWTQIADPSGAEAYAAGHLQTQKFLRKSST